MGPMNKIDQERHVPTMSVAGQQKIWGLRTKATTRNAKFKASVEIRGLSSKDQIKYG